MQISVSVNVAIYIYTSLRYIDVCSFYRNFSFDCYISVYFSSCKRQIWVGVCIKLISEVICVGVSLLCSCHRIGYGFCDSLAVIVGECSEYFWCDVDFSSLDIRLIHFEFHTVDIDSECVNRLVRCEVLRMFVCIKLISEVVCVGVSLLCSCHRIGYGFCDSLAVIVGECSEYFWCDVDSLICSVRVKRPYCRSVALNGQVIQTRFISHTTEL